MGSLFLPCFKLAWTDGRLWVVWIWKSTFKKGRLECRPRTRLDEIIKQLWIFHYIYMDTNFRIWQIQYLHSLNNSLNYSKCKNSTQNQINSINKFLELIPQHQLQMHHKYIDSSCNFNLTTTQRSKHSLTQSPQIDYKQQSLNALWTILQQLYLTISQQLDCSTHNQTHTNSTTIPHSMSQSIWKDTFVLQYKQSLQIEKSKIAQ